MAQKPRGKTDAHYAAVDAITKGKWAEFQAAQADEPDAAENARSGNWGPAIANVLKGGDALIIGCTRDGGSIAVTLMAGTDRLKLYAADPDELDLLLTRLATAK